MRSPTRPISLLTGTFRFMALSFSAKERRSTLAAAANIPKEQRTEEQKKLAKIYQDMVEAEASIANSSLIPSRILLWVTTSRNKEGINIKDTDINDIFVESHNISDIIQMAGRVRHGAENVYIIVDPPGHKKELFPEDHVRAKLYLAPDARKIDDQTDLTKWTDNAFLRDLCHKERIWDFTAIARPPCCHIARMVMQSADTSIISITPRNMSAMTISATTSATTT